MLVNDHVKTAKIISSVSFTYISTKRTKSRATYKRRYKLTTNIFDNNIGIKKIE